MTSDTASNTSSMASKSTEMDQQKTHANGNSYKGWKYPLDPSLYEVDYEFFSGQTGIKDPEELKKHILKVQREAFAVSTD